MLRSKSFVKRTKKGNVVRVVKEHYLRDDIWCSCTGCQVCKHEQPILSLSPQLNPLFERQHYIVPDTNILMNQMDIIEHALFYDVIVLQTVLEELRNLSLPVYNRLRAIINDTNRRFYVFSNEHNRDTYVERIKDESPNDRNDRAIRVATKWYDDHLKKLEIKSGISVVLLSDDAANRAKAKEEGLLTCSVREYIEALDKPELLDMIAQSETTAAQVGVDKKLQHEEYITSLQISSGVKAGTLHQGTLNISLHNYLEGSIYATVEGEEREIMILGRTHLNRAVHGDSIAVKLLPKSEWKKSSQPSAAVIDEDDEKNIEEEGETSEESKGEEASKPEAESNERAQPTGKVVGIIRRNWRPYCGFIEKKSVRIANNSTTPQNVLFVPIDQRIPKIKIRTRQAHSLLGQRIIVSIDSWAKDTTYPAGHFIKALGEAGDRATETEVLLLEHDVPHHEFSQQVLSDLPAEGTEWVASDQEIARRTDLRHLNICSIDPPGCTDIDDALHVRTLPNGNYEVGVHIADVTHFVKNGTAMDNEAASRGTTVYLVDRRIDMLPPLLGTNLCSLRSNVDRLAFSCIWELNENAEIQDVHFTKSIIASKASLTYDEAQLRIDDERMQDDLTKGIRVLNNLAKKLRQSRVNQGALTLASPEVRFNLENDSQDPVDVELKELKDTNALVEEFMLLANISVAKKIFSHFPDSSMLRRHPTPPETKFEQLTKAIEVLGFKLNIESSKALADSLDKAVIPDDPYFNKLLRIMTTRCMMQAVYFSSGTVPQQEFVHYGLATPIYTHFTSPIRRYADVMVHRLLSACIGVEGSYSSELTDKDKMSKISDVLNRRHRMAQHAARSSVELYTNLFFRGKLVQEEGYVTRVLKNGFIVLVPRYGIESIVHANPSDSKETPYFTYNTTTDSLEANDSSVNIKLFSKVTVQLTVDEDLVGGGAGGMRQKLRMDLVEPHVPGLSVAKQDMTRVVKGKSLDKEEEQVVKRVKKTTQAIN
ncbi:exosome catalytic subunit dis3 [Basidiobolus ranarum]|uniref:Exosome catalytic subunit dis3 n=1 Tax=Basidiobolus ranarum TaxID=34480 RepID=A0ABR2WUH8_9FUNG